MNAPHFKYYLEWSYLDSAPEPIFGIWIEKASGYSDVSGDIVMKSGKPLPLFPDYKTWRMEVTAKRRCGRCWAVVRGHDDLVRHTQIHHSQAPIHMPVGYKAAV
jgi:hypothetical protein